MKTALFFIAVLLAPLPALAQGTQAPVQAPAAAEGSDAEQAQRYRECLTLARHQPEKAFDAAGVWEGLGGGEPARHCTAVALLGMGEYGEAATRLEALAEASHRAPEMRAGMLSQAAQAWLMQGEVERAVAVQTSALALLPPESPAVPDLLVDRAVSYAEAQAYPQAVADLSRAIELDPLRVDAYVLRASAHRYLNELDAAMTDVQTAIQRDRYNQEALLERGILHRLAGDDDGARSDWLAVVNVNPDTPAADTARANLAKLDVRQ